MANPKISVGIDFGTTNSCIAFNNGRTTEVIKGPGKERLFPSIALVLEGDVKPLIGRRAATEGRDKPEFCFRHVKRLFGQKWREGEDAGFQAVKGPDGMIWLRGPDRDHSPAEIASFVITEMLDCAEFRLLGRRPEEAVITHPAHYNDAQMRCILEAGKLAGLKKVHLLKEPEAAAIAYGLYSQTIQHNAVFDVGGGTVDFTVVHGGRNRFEAKETNGIPWGGVDADYEIVDWMKANWHATYGSDLGADGAAISRLREAAETAKIKLSEDDEARIDVPLIELVPPRSLTDTLTKAKFEEMMVEPIRAMMAVCQKTLDEAGLTIGNISNVLLVGGMTNVPAIRNAVASFFGIKPKADQDPDEVVAMGAAIHAAMLDGRMKPYTLVSCVSHDFGFETTGDVFCKIITKGEAYPVEKKVRIIAEADDQDELAIHVLEGDPFIASEASRLKAYDHPIPPAPKGEAALELTFIVDANGMKSVRHPNGVIYEGAANV